MIYRIYKETGRIGTGLEKTEGSFKGMPEAATMPENQVSLAAYDTQTNTIHVFNDQVIDMSSIIQKFKNYCDLPNNHQFSVLRK